MSLTQQTSTFWSANFLIYWYDLPVTLDILYVIKRAGSVQRVSRAGGSANHIKH